MARPRRDPRAERAARVVGGGARPRLDMHDAAPQGRRRRRDPRAERNARRVARSESPRPRFDAARTDVASPRFAAVEAESFVEAARAAHTIVVLENPDFHVLVVPDAASDRLSTHDRQLISAARVLAGSEGAVVVLASESCAELGAAGADRRVTTAATLPPSAYDPEARVAYVVATMATLSPRHVLFAETTDGGDLARRVAALTGEAMFADAEALSPQRLRRPARNRRVEQSAAPPRLITIAPDAVAAYTGAPREARALDLAREPVASRTANAILDARLVPADPATVPLAVAAFVAAAGNGVTDFATFRQLVAALAATPGASRVLCDAGIMARDRQVGASGTLLAASCYLALGIAGAPQHLQGVADCEHVVAVNTDLHAAMIERADLAIVQDAQLVMPALLAALAREAEDLEQPA